MMRNSSVPVWTTAPRRAGGADMVPATGATIRVRSSWTSSAESAALACASLASADLSAVSRSSAVSRLIASFWSSVSARCLAARAAFERRLGLAHRGLLLRDFRLDQRIVEPNEKLAGLDGIAFPDLHLDDREAARLGADDDLLPRHHGAGRGHHGPGGPGFDRGNRHGQRGRRNLGGLGTGFGRGGIPGAAGEQQYCQEHRSRLHHRPHSVAFRAIGGSLAVMGRR